MNLYVLSQIFVCISTIFLGLSYVSKNKKTIMLLCIIYCIFYGTHYLLLGALTGTIMTVISAIRNICLYINAKKNKKNSFYFLISFIGFEIVMGCVFFQDVFSLFSITASILSTYSIWQDNIKIYRFLALPVSLCFIIYGIHIESLLSIVFECILLLMEIIGIVQLYYNKFNNKCIDYKENLE